MLCIILQLALTLRFHLSSAWLVPGHPNRDPVPKTPLPLLPPSLRASLAWRSPGVPGNGREARRPLGAAWVASEGRELEPLKTKDAMEKLKWGALPRRASEGIQTAAAGLCLEVMGRWSAFQKPESNTLHSYRV